MSDFVPLSKVPDQARDAFYKESFGERAEFLSKHWKWVYRAGWLANAEPVVVVEGPRVVGHAGVIPGRLRLGGRVEPAIWFVDYALSPEKRGLGLGKALALEWMKLCPNRLTFCNEASMRVFVGLGWTRKDDTACRFLPLELASAAKPRGALFRLAAAVADAPYGAALDAMLKSAPDLTPELLDERTPRLFELTAARGCAVERDAEWARWRFLESPWKDDYRLFKLEGAFVAVRGFVYKGRRRLHVAYASSGAPSTLSRLLRGVAKWGRAHEADWLWAETNDPLLLGAAQRILPGRYPAPFAWHSDDIGTRALLSQSALPLQAADADNDLLLVPDAGSTFW